MPCLWNPKSATAATALALAALGPSCEQGSETITYITETDTLTIHDTTRIKDTVIRLDTLRDTARIRIGPPHSYLLFGVLYDGLPADTGYDYDSIGGYLSLSAKPSIREAVVHYGSHALQYTANQTMISFFEGYNNNTRIFPALADAQYEANFRDTANSFDCRIRIPYFAADTSKMPSFDTVSHTQSFPRLLDTLLFFDGQGNRYDSVDYTRFDNNIQLDEDLTIVWRNAASAWYAVECVRFSFFNEAYGILDTFTADTQITIPHGFFYQDAATDSAKQYEILLVTVVPVNGPYPTTWDSATSFDSKGYLFAMHYDNVMTPLNALWENAGSRPLAKRSIPTFPAARETVMRIFAHRLRQQQ